MQKEKYRFDDAYEKVYEYDKDSNSYINLGSYHAFGIDKSMSETEMIEIVESDLCQVIGINNFGEIKCY